MSKLTTRDELDYDHYKTKARNAWLRAKEGWLQWVEFVQPIRDRRLYQKGGYKTFEEFCEKEYGITRRNVDQLINSAFVVQGLPTNLRTDVLNEATARELGKVESDNRVAVVQEAKRNGPITAPSIKKAVAQIAAKSEPKAGAVPVDDMGFPIPAHVLPNWELGQRVFQTALTAISQAKSTIVQLMESEDGKKAHSVLQDAREELKQVYFHVAQYKPIVVCLECEGESVRNGSSCRLCGRSGIQGRIRLDGFPALIEARIRKHNLAPYKVRAGTTAFQ